MEHLMEAYVLQRGPQRLTYLQLRGDFEFLVVTSVNLMPHNDRVAVDKEPGRVPLVPKCWCRLGLGLL
jgi:hypothetical protein